MISGRAQAASLPEAPTMTEAAMQPPLYPKSGPDYRPVVTLNGWTCRGDRTETGRIISSPSRWRELAPGMKAHLWGYNGQSPGLTIEAVEGDKVRIFVTNKLPENTAATYIASLPNGMDGVGGVTQPHIYAAKPSSTSSSCGSPGRSCITRIPTRWCRWQGMMGFFVVHPRILPSAASTATSYSCLTL